MDRPARDAHQEVLSLLRSRVEEHVHHCLGEGLVTIPGRARAHDSPAPSISPPNILFKVNQNDAYL
jgi:hypothetical protein